ncbi:restriction endonuclease [Campylobacter helveticus]|uniref:restriction endonuclease n=1 Tax=Campylobacter helveticus TaxID=28898 RepID=UPI0022EA90D1|nr:restriction endonuclease [Campylobacter helveticus]
MSKIINAKGRDVKKFGESGYTRVIGNSQLGQLLSRVQATVIANGSELEKMIVERCNAIKDIDKFIDDVTQSKINQGTFLCTKRILKKTQNYKESIKSIEPDMLIFIVSRQRICKVIELKDGETFDTKKAKAEKENLVKFSQNFGVKIPFVTDYYICCFNQSDKTKIHIGMKGVFGLENILTGRELCEILGIDFDEMISLRNQVAKENLTYFIDELLAIPEIKAKIKARI